MNFSLKKKKGVFTHQTAIVIFYFPFYRSGNILKNFYNVIITVPEQWYGEMCNHWFPPVAPFFGELLTYRVFRLKFFDIGWSEILIKSTDFKKI